jgi:hypothetical protein
VRCYGRTTPGPPAIAALLQSETTANWKAESGDKWTVPINLLFATLSSFGPFPASYQFGGAVFGRSSVDRANLEAPGGEPRRARTRA